MALRVERNSLAIRVLDVGEYWNTNVGTNVSVTERAVLSRRGRVRATLFDYLALTKPRTIHVVVGVIPAMLLAERGVVAASPILNTLTGAILMTAGANTLNCVADADIDKLMKRTAGRPLARGAVSTRGALVFGLALCVGAFVWLWVTTNPLAGLLAVGTVAFYVVVYTLLIKRHTSQNVVWGGAANGMPVVIGWAAVTGSIGWQALVMFAIIFCWTPPHTWALAMRRKEDYRAAGVPMLPAVATEQHVAKRILRYAWLTVLATLLLALATGGFITILTEALPAGLLREMSGDFGVSAALIGQLVTVYAAGGTRNAT